MVGRVLELGLRHCLEECHEEISVLEGRQVDQTSPLPALGFQSTFLPEE
jgi:hypothetical protein